MSKQIIFNFSDEIDSDDIEDIKATLENAMCRHLDLNLSFNEGKGYFEILYCCDFCGDDISYEQYEKYEKLCQNCFDNEK